MRKELTDQIRACSVLYGAQLEDEDVQKLQEMAAAIGINDKDTLFILLVLLQSHFKAVSALKDTVPGDFSAMNLSEICELIQEHKSNGPVMEMKR